MGLLVAGEPMPWEDASKHTKYIKKHGVKQFLHLYHSLKNRSGDKLLWGDEVEYMCVEFDDEKKTARLSLCAPEIIELLSKDEREGKECEFLWRPEYARYMIEGTPGGPYQPHDLFRQVEKSMRDRRREAQALLPPNVFLMSLTVFPRLGVDVFTSPPLLPLGPTAQSLFIPDGVIMDHLRFPTLTANIRKRRGEKVCITVPVFTDRNTQRPLPAVTPLTSHPDVTDSLPQLPAADVPREVGPHDIYMDAMAFGMGNSCLQVTFQTADVSEARYIYDQLIPVAPIMLALTAASPIFRGYLADQDVRWDVIAGAVDDRTPLERSHPPTHHLERDMRPTPTTVDEIVALQRNLEAADKEASEAAGISEDGSPAGACCFPRHVRKSRYSSVSLYISEDPRMDPAIHNNVPVQIDRCVLKELVDSGVDTRLARHVAHLFIRDPLVVYGGRVEEVDDESSTEHFENVQSTNWQTVRFKPPPSTDSSIGWRVEFRPMEAQLTDFENAAFSVFTVLLTRVLATHSLNFYMPMSEVEANMRRAHRRNPRDTQKFFFRACFKPDSTGADTQEYSVKEIMLGDGADMVGLIPMVEDLVDMLEFDLETRHLIDRYLGFIKMRADGSLLTTAQWMREFVRKHPDYKGDSVVCDSIQYDLLKKCLAIQMNPSVEPSLMGTDFWPAAPFTRPSTPINE